MGDPVTFTLAAASAAAAGGGAILKANAALEDGEAAAEAARFNADMAIEQSRVEEARRRRASRRVIATQRAAIAKSGVQVEGSPLELLAANAAEFEIEALQARWEGNTASLLERRRAKTIRHAARRAYYAELLGGAAQVGAIGFQAFGGRPGPGAGGAPASRGYSAGTERTMAGLRREVAARGGG